MSKATSKSTIESIIEAEVQKMIAKMPTEIFSPGVLSNPKNFVFSHSQLVSIAQAAFEAGEKQKATPFSGGSSTNP